MRTLEIEREFLNCSNIEEARNVYRKLSKQYHPDLGGDVLMIWRQLLGTCQYHLKEDKRKAYMKIYYDFAISDRFDYWLEN